MNKTLRLNNLKTRTDMNAKTSVFVVCVEAIIYLLLNNLCGCTFKDPTCIHRSRKLLTTWVTTSYCTTQEVVLKTNEETQIEENLKKSVRAI